LKKALLVIGVVLFVAGSAWATTLPGGDYRASLVDRSNIFAETDSQHPGLDPQVYGAVPAAGQENRSVFSIDGINVGQRSNDFYGVRMISDLNPQVPVSYSNGALSGMLYDINLLPASVIPGPVPGPGAAAWFLELGPGGRYADAASGGGTQGTWTDTVPGIGGLLATTAGGYGGLLVVYDDPALNTDFSAGGAGPAAWTEASTAAPDASLTAADDFPTISDVSPWLVAVLAPEPAAYGYPAGTVMHEVITGQTNSGLGFANIIGGAAASQFDTDVFGVGLDIRLEWDPIIHSGPIDGWQLSSDDPVQFSIIPEPATLTLLGLGLAGLGLYRKRRK